MTRRSFSRKSVSKDKDVMHQENIFLNIDAYNKFIQHQFYIDETHLNLPLIISELNSDNPMEN